MNFRPPASSLQSPAFLWLLGALALLAPWERLITVESRAPVEAQKSVFADDGRRTAGLVQNTIALARQSVALALPLGVLAALLVAKSDLRGRRLFALLLFWQLLIPLYVVAAAWLAGFGLQGWVGERLGAGPWLRGQWGAVWIHAMAAAPLVALIVGAALRAVEPELEEDALLVVPAWKVALLITLPRVGPAIAVAALAAAIGVVSEMTVTDLLGLRTFAEELYTNFALGDPEEAVERALQQSFGVAIMVVAMLLVLWRVAPRGGVVARRPPLVFALGRWQVPAVMAAIVIVVLPLAVPVVNLIYKAGMLFSREDGVSSEHWSAAQAAQIIALSPGRYVQEFRGSLTTALAAATAAVAIAVPLASAARRGRWAWLAIGLAAIAWAVPSTIWGFLLNRVCFQTDWEWPAEVADRTLILPITVQMLRGLPPALLVVWYALASIPREHLDAARLDGAGWLRSAFSIELGQRRAAPAVAWLLAFTAALGELGGTMLVGPAGSTTVSFRAFELIHYGVEEQLAGLCLTLLGLIAGLAIAIGLFLRLGRRVH